MKPGTFKVEHPELGSFRWRFERQRQVASTLGRKMDGWELTTHDDCRRFCEGNWHDFVPFVHRIADNYGVACNLS